MLPLVEAVEMFTCLPADPDAPPAIPFRRPQVEAQRRGKRAAQAAAEHALRDRSAALKKLLAFDKEKTRWARKEAEK